MRRRLVRRRRVQEDGVADAEDVRLLSAYVSGGDTEALSALIERNAKWMLAMLRGLTANDSDAEDALQDAWRRVISAGGYRGGSARAYLARVARSAAVDAFRRKGRELAVLDAPDEDGSTPVAELVDESPSADEAFETKATAEEIRSAVRALPGAQRQVFMMRVEGQLAFREIAEELGLPLGTVLTWMRRATIALRKKLARET